MRIRICDDYALPPSVRQGMRWPCGLPTPVASGSSRCVRVCDVPLSVDRQNVPWRGGRRTWPQTPRPRHPAVGATAVVVCRRAATSGTDCQQSVIPTSSLTPGQSVPPKTHRVARWACPAVGSEAWPALRAGPWHPPSGLARLSSRPRAAGLHFLRESPGLQRSGHKPSWSKIVRPMEAAGPLVRYPNESPSAVADGRGMSAADVWRFQLTLPERGPTLPVHFRRHGGWVRSRAKTLLLRRCPQPFTQEIER
jgi:hypothetical protein